MLLFIDLLVLHYHKTVFQLFWTFLTNEYGKVKIEKILPNIACIKQLRSNSDHFPPSSQVKLFSVFIALVQIMRPVCLMLSSFYSITIIHHFPDSFYTISTYYDCFMLSLQSLS